MKWRENWGKSFGTIGYQLATGKSMGLAYDKVGMVYKQDWMCGTSAEGTAATDTSACPKKYASATVSAASTATTWGANATVFYVAVSVWSAGTAGPSVASGTFGSA